MNINLSPSQYAFLYLLDTPFKAFVGGMGSGKTFSLTLKLALHHCKYPGTTTGYFAPTNKMVKSIFFPSIMKVADMLGFQVKLHRSPDDLKAELFRNGVSYGEIRCYSMQDPEKIIGFEMSLGVVDEIDTMKYDKASSAWTYILARRRLKIEGYTNEVVVGTTPEGFNFVYDMFGDEPTKSYSMVQARTIENAHNLPEDYIDGLIETYPAQLVDAYLNGNFVNLNNSAVLYAYDRANKLNMSTETVQEDDTLFIGMDFNIERMCAAIYVKRLNDEGEVEWHCVDEIVNAFNTYRTCEIIRSRYPENKVIVYPDATGKNRKTSSGKTVAHSDLKELEDWGFKWKAWDSNPPIKDRYTTANKQIEKGILKFNQEKVPTVCKYMMQYAHDDNGMPDKNSPFDDLMDALTYPIAYCFPIRRPMHQIKSVMYG